MHRIPCGWLLLTIILLGLNLRPALASLSPLVNHIQALANIQSGTFSLLTTVPIFLMGLIGLLLKRVYKGLSAPTGITLAMALITAACLARFYIHNVGLLMLSATLAGIGIAIAQVLIPGVIKACFHRHAAKVMGLFTTSIMGGAAIASGVTPLTITALGVNGALVMWALPAALALLIWIIIVKLPAVNQPLNSAANTTLSSAVNPATHHGVLWRLCLLFGLSTGGFTLLLAWLPGYYLQLGWGETQAGGLLSLFTFIEIIAGLLVTFLAHHVSLRTALLVAISNLTLGLLLLLMLPLQTVWLCITLLGLGIGSLFPLSMIATINNANSPTQAEYFASMVQGTGYMLAAAFPYAAGVLNDHLTDLSYAWVAMLIICIPLFALAFSLRLPATHSISAAPNSVTQE